MLQHKADCELVLGSSGPLTVTSRDCSIGTAVDMGNPRCDMTKCPTCAPPEL